MPARLLKRHNLCVVTRTYKKDGQDKNNFERIGQLLEFEGDDGGKWMKVDLYHMPRVQISVFEQKPKDDVSNEPAKTTKEIDIDNIQW